MRQTKIEFDERRAGALEAAVSAGGAESVQAAVDQAVDSWLTEQALQNTSDETLQRLWNEGLASGDAEALDFAKLKAEAHRAR